MKDITDRAREIFNDKNPIGDGEFTFSCHKRIACFNRCCRRVNIYLFPYDVLRLKNHLNIHSEQFLEKYTHTFIRDGNPYFPAVTMKLLENEEMTCPFMGSEGCTVYENRPNACRTYPLERVASIIPLDGIRGEYYYLEPKPHCLGHRERKKWKVTEWVRDQGAEAYNTMNDLWSEMYILYKENPWGPEGLKSKYFKMAFMSSYNLDRFRMFVFESTFLKRYRVEPEMLEKIRSDDSELLKFGFSWMKLILIGAECEFLKLKH